MVPVLVAVTVMLAVTMGAAGTGWGLGLTGVVGVLAAGEAEEPQPGISEEAARAADPCRRRRRVSRGWSGLQIKTAVPVLSGRLRRRLV